MSPSAAGLAPAIVQFPVGGADADPGFIVPHLAVDRTRFDFAIDLPGPGRSPIEKAHLAPGVIELRQEVGRSVFGSVYWCRVRPQWSRILGCKVGEKIERSRLDPGKGARKQKRPRIGQRERSGAIIDRGKSLEGLCSIGRRATATCLCQGQGRRLIQRFRLPAENGAASKQRNHRKRNALIHGKKSPSKSRNASGNFASSITEPINRETFLAYDAQFA